MICAAWTAVIIWVFVAGYLSFQGGESTTKLSYGIAGRIAELAETIGWRVPMEKLHFHLRTMAHVIVFFILGVLFSYAMNLSAEFLKRTGWRSVIISLSVCSLLAVASEFFKIWIDGRHFDADETILNVMGTWSGTGIVYLVYWLRAG